MFWLSSLPCCAGRARSVFENRLRDADDHLGRLKMVIAVGVVMGLHAAWRDLHRRRECDVARHLTYLPRSLLYIVSMAPAMSACAISSCPSLSPICNASAASPQASAVTEELQYGA